MKVVFCTPTIRQPHPAYLAALEASVPVLDAAGIEHYAVYDVGNPYISYARAGLLRKALDVQADVVVFIDHDLSWRPADLLKLIETPGEVVAGTYRFKNDVEEYMGGWFVNETDNTPIVKDGCFKSERVPAGFLKITKDGVDRFMRSFPHLIFGTRYNPSVDLFNHGVIDGVWYGEDMAFSKRWSEAFEPIVLVPDLSLDHHHGDKIYPGNLHEFMLRQPGGSGADKRVKLTARQSQVVEGVRLGKQNKHIAHDLNMAEATVKAHLRTVMKKMHATNRTEVAVSTLLRG